jgi:AraC-like DNA-binding protein
MNIDNRLLLEVLDHSLRFELHGANVSEIGPGHTTGWRTLPGCVTAHLIDVAVLIERSDGEDRTYPGGSCICLAPQLHHCSSVATGRGLSRWSHFTCWIFGSVPVMSLLQLPDSLGGRVARRVGDLNAELGRLANSPTVDLHRAVRMHAVAFTLISLLAERSPMLPQGQALLVHADRLAPVLDHIERHLGTPLSRPGLARIAGLSPSRFHALFKAAIGAAPLEYVVSRRIQRAQQLLIAGDLSVQDIAARVGFADPFHFSRLFKSRCGSSPLWYRRQVRSGLA